MRLKDHLVESSETNDSYALLLSRKNCMLDESVDALLLERQEVLEAEAWHNPRFSA